jgi:hypothetical protein
VKIIDKKDQFENAAGTTVVVSFKEE